MMRYVAFLRAINVGGHTVKMEHLRRLFDELGFSKVESFIASGNILFESEVMDRRILEGSIEQHLAGGLGFRVATFIRTADEVAAIARYEAFSASDLQAAAAQNIAFLPGPLDENDTRKVLALKSDIDTFRVHHAEVYWLCRQKQSDSRFSNAVLEKVLGKPSTLRGAATVQKIAGRLNSAG